MGGTHEVGRRPFMPDSTLSRRSAALWARGRGHRCFLRRINSTRKLQKNPFFALCRRLDLFGSRRDPQQLVSLRTMRPICLEYREMIAPSDPFAAFGGD